MRGAHPGKPEMPPLLFLTQEENHLKLLLDLSQIKSPDKAAELARFHILTYLQALAKGTDNRKTKALPREDSGQL